MPPKNSRGTYGFHCHLPFRDTGFGSNQLPPALLGEVLQSTPMACMAQDSSARATSSLSHTTVYWRYYYAASHSNTPCHERSKDVAHQQLSKPGIEPFQQPLHLPHPGKLRKPDSSSWTWFTKPTGGQHSRAENQPLSHTDNTRLWSTSTWHWFHWSWEGVRPAHLCLGILRQGIDRRRHRRFLNK